MDHRVPSRFCSSQARITLVNKIQMAAAAAAGRQRQWRQQQQQQLMLRVTHLQRLLLAYVGIIRCILVELLYLSHDRTLCNGDQLVLVFRLQKSRRSKWKMSDRRSYPES
jgi:hypothetical protein